MGPFGALGQIPMDNWARNKCQFECPNAGCEPQIGRSGCDAGLQSRRRALFAAYECDGELCNSWCNDSLHDQWKRSDSVGRCGSFGILTEHWQYYAIARQGIFVRVWPE